jgi:uncharacterized protein YcaQ
MIRWSPAQINTWRMSRHHLLARADRGRVVEVVAAIGGLQAQVISAAELALHARVDRLEPGDFAKALWDERALVKTWAMRGTLHVLAAGEYPRVQAALSTLSHYRRASWLRYHGVTHDELESIIAGVRDTLDGSGITREQLADAIVERTGSTHVRDLLRSGWGALLKPAAFQGHLCFGPNQGQNVTFVRPDRWLGSLAAVDPGDAMTHVLRRYLAAYGPATTDDFARWFGFDQARARRLMRAAGDLLVEVEVGGWSGSMLAEDASAVQQLEPSPSVRLLPAFDPYTIALYRQPHVLDQQHRAKVSRQQGWISPVVLREGRIVGVWDQQKQRDQLRVTVTTFEQLADEVEEGVATEARRIAAFAGAEAAVTYAA